MPKNSKGHRFLSESSSTSSRSKSRSHSKSHKKRRSRSRSDSRKKHKKQFHDRKSDQQQHKYKRDRSSSLKRSSSQSKSNSKHKYRNKKEERQRRRRREEKEDARLRYPSPPKKEEENKEPEVEPEKPCFVPSGILAEYSNNLNGVTLKFTEPLERANPTENWRIFPFKGDEELPVINIHKQSVYLFGKDERVVDILIEHPTCSSQHCVIQFREISKRDTQGGSITMVKPYLMDLESTNGTYLNGEKIEPARYYELLPKDVIKFANSSRDYVIMKDDAGDDEE